jgi:hypothetical protein
MSHHLFATLLTLAIPEKSLLAKGLCRRLPLKPAIPAGSNAISSHPRHQGNKKPPEIPCPF